jgi:hypothetical protein
MVLSIRYSTIKKKEAARFEYPAIRTTSFVFNFSTVIFTLYRGKNTRIIKVNTFHDDTTADEKYQFTCSVVFSSKNSASECIFFSITKI